MIIKDHIDNIDSFENYLKDKLSSIEQLSSDDARLFKKVLFVSFIDSLAACVYPGRGNKDRFLSIVDRFSDWTHRNDYCLLHLAKFTSVTSDPILEKVRNFSQKEVNSWIFKQNRSGVVELSNTPKASEVEKFWTNPTKESGLQYKLQDFKHSHLLYKLRNSLVHQFQANGTELGFFIPDSPYYQVVNSYDSNENLVPSSIELVYPTNFLSTISSSILKNVSTYFRTGNINPFPHYHAGDYWLEGLNR